MKKRIETKVAVIGLGILGSSVVRALMQTGERDIVAVEREPTFGGATAHSFGMLRVYHDSPNLRELALASIKLVRGSSEQRFAEARPFLSVRKSTPALLANAKTITTQDYPIEILSPKQLASRFGIAAEATQVGVLEPQALTFDPHELLAHYHRATLPEISVIRDDVCCLIENPHSVDIIMRGGTSVRAAKLVIAAGAGSVPLLAGRGPSFKEKVIAYSVAPQSLPLPQYLNTESKEFISQRKGRTYFRLAEENPYLPPTTPGIAGPISAVDLASDTCQESFGQVPGSKRVFFMGAWGGNAFKLSCGIL